MNTNSQTTGPSIQEQINEAKAAVYDRIAANEKNAHEIGELNKRIILLNNIKNQRPHTGFNPQVVGENIASSESVSPAAEDLKVADVNVAEEVAAENVASATTV